MKAIFNILLSLLFVLPVYAQKLTATSYDFPNPVDTKSKEIKFQERKVFSDDDGGVYASNDFPAARLNNFERVNSRFYNATIEAENLPINESAWYAFKIWSKEDKNIWIRFLYEEGEGHRYIPKLSTDGDHWQPIDSTHFTIVDDGSAMMNIDLSSDTLWVAAQELADSRRVAAWSTNFAKDDRVSFSAIGPLNVIPGSLRRARVEIREPC